MTVSGASVRLGTAREVNDFYPTPAHCTRKLLNAETFETEIEEPACGDGAISRVLAGAGHRVFSSDLIDRGYGRGGIDFLTRTRLRASTVVTNPPFKLAEEFLFHACDLGARKIALFQRLGWLEGARRYDALWSKYPPVRIWCFARRPTLWRGDDPEAQTSGGTIAMAWFIWEPYAPVTKPEFGWLR